MWYAHEYIYVYVYNYVYVYADVYVCVFVHVSVCMLLFMSRVYVLCSCVNIRECFIVRCMSMPTFIIVFLHVFVYIYV